MLLTGGGTAAAQPGAPAAALDYPYVAALARRSTGDDVFFCTGTLVAPRWILTAAHCFHDRNGARIPDADLWAVAGNDGVRTAPKEAMVAIDRVIVHPGYAPGTQSDDLALVRLAEIMGPLTAEVARPREALPDTATALGFGSFFEGELAGQALSSTGAPAAQTSDRLRRARMRLRDPAWCAGLLGKVPNGNELCAGADPEEACVGDSGAPLVVPLRLGEARLIGVVSRGSGCAVRDPAVVYTNVAPYADWIAATIAGR